MPDTDPSQAIPVAAPKRQWSDLWPRVVSALVMVGLALSTAFAGGTVFAAFWIVASAAILWEWQFLIGHGGAARRAAIGIAALLLAAGVSIAGLPWLAVAAILVGAVALTLAAPPPVNRAMAVGGLVYAGVPALAVILLRASVPDGLSAILWLFAVVWGTDVLAYFGGRLVGGPKLSPRLSPSKTWSGFLIGITAGASAGLLVAPTKGLAVFIAGLAGGAIAQAGDLFESGLKRRYGVKDASHLIPGHGGVMDRLDGFITAATATACLGVARAGLDAAGQGLFNWP